jgi:glycosyltransferase 2 family protein
MAGVGVALIVYLAFGRDLFGGRLGKLIGDGKIGSAIKEQAGKFAAGLIMLRHTHHHSIIAIESALLWVIYAVQGYLVLMAFHFINDYPLIAASPILASLVILVLNAVGVSLPSAPGSVGTFHAICIFGLSLFDVPPDPAAGYAVVIHAVTFIFYLLGGMPFMWREGLHLGQLRQLSPQEESDSSAKSIKESAS